MEMKSTIGEAASTMEAEQFHPGASLLRRGLHAVLFVARARATGNLFLFGSRLAGAAAGFLVQVLLAQALSPASLGVFYTATSLTVIAALVATCGYDGVTARFVLRYKQRNRPLLCASLWHQTWRECLLATLILGGLLLAWATLSPSLDQDARLALLLAALTIPALVSLRIVGGFAGAERRFALALLPEVLLRPILFLLIVAGLGILGFSMTSSTAVLIFAALAYLAAIVQFTPLAKVLARQKSAAPPRLATYWRRQAWPMMIAVMFSALFADLAVVVQAPFLAPAEIAQFGVCIKIAMLVGFVVQVSHSMLLPDLADAYAQRRTDHVRTLLLRAAPVPVAVSMAALLGTWLWGGWVLSLFGEEFASARGALLCLVVCQVVRAVAGPGPGLLMLHGAQKTNLWVSIGSTATLIVASVILSPAHGLWGAVAATSLAYIFWILVSGWCLHSMAAPRTDLLGLLLPKISHKGGWR